MRFLHIGKDGGPQSTVTGYWLAEVKKLFSVALLKFENGSRESFHSHAFNSISWVLKGSLREELLDGGNIDYTADAWPIVTRRKTFHRVFSSGTTWVLTIRGPWSKTWREYDPKTEKFSRLTDGRVVVKKEY